MLKITNPAPALIDLPKDAEMLDPAGKSLGVISGAIKDQVSPYEVEVNGGHYRVARASPGGVSQLVLIHNPDANIRPVPVVGTADCTAAVAAEHERTRKAAIDAVTALK